MKEDLRNIIKQTADNHIDDVNPDMIWSGIENKLSQKKKKRYGGFWVFSVLSLVAAFLIYALLWSSEESNSQSSAINYAGLNTSELADGLLTAQRNSEEYVIDNEIVKSKTAENENVESYVGVKENEIELIDQKGEADRKINVQSNVLNSSELQKAIIAYSRTEKSKNANSNLIPLRVENNQFEQSENVDYSNLITSETHSIVENDRSVSIESILTRDLFIATQIRTINPDEFPIEERFVDDLEYEDYVFEAPYQEDERKLKFLNGIELYSGISLGSKSVTDTNQAYAQSRNDTEELLEQWNAGVRFDLVKVLDFQLQAGVNYAMITDRMRIENEYSNLEEYTYVQSRLMGDALVVIDSFVVMDSTSTPHSFVTRGLTFADHESISTLRSNYNLYGLELGLKRRFGK